MIKAVLFDLDGTLLDTLADLMDAVNHALRSLGFAERTRDEVRSFIGNGVGRLIRCALPADAQDAEDECLRQFKARYALHMDDKTEPYPGVLAMLDALGERGVLCAVVSNKFDGAVGPLCDKYFGARIALAIGERAGMPRKPAPDGCQWLMERLNVAAHETIYVGDSDTDVQTAHNAGLRCIGVSWGFREKADLQRAGADAIADDVDGLMRQIGAWLGAEMKG